MINAGKTETDLNERIKENAYISLKTNSDLALVLTFGICPVCVLNYLRHFDERIWHGLQLTLDRKYVFR